MVILYFPHKMKIVLALCQEPNFKKNNILDFWKSMSLEDPD